MAVILQATFWNVFARGKMYFNRISQQFVPRGQVDDRSALAQDMAWRDKLLPEPTLTQFTDDNRASVCGLSTHWGRVTHICVSKITIIGSDNGLSPGRRQAIIWINAGILLIWNLGTNFNEILSEIHTFSFKKMHFEMSSAQWRLFSIGLNVLTLSAKSHGQFEIWPLFAKNNNKC